MTDPDEIQQMIDDCEKREEKLSDWERGFIDSIYTQFVKNNGLAPNQLKKLEEIWERIT